MSKKKSRKIKDRELVELIALATYSNIIYNKGYEIKVLTDIQVTSLMKAVRERFGESQKELIESVERRINQLEGFL